MSRWHVSEAENSGGGPGMELLSSEEREDFQKPQGNIEQKAILNRGG